ncbi:MAG: ATPase domain-containing protein, partial [Opitutales bacterium]
VPGLDDVLSGGLPRRRIYLVEGDPGVGKTTLGLQFLLEGVRRKEKSLYIAFSETKEEILAVARSHDWDMEEIHIFGVSAIEEQMKANTGNTFFHPSEVELHKTTQVLMEQIEQLSPDRIVFDSLSEMRLMAETPLRYRRQMLSLKQYLAGRACTVLFLDDLTPDSTDLQVRSIAHGVITLLKSSPQYGISRRSLNVEKIRGVRFREGYHDFSIQKGGLVAFPRLVAAEHRKDFKRGCAPSGLEAMDNLLGGGLDRGTSSIFMGPPGTGKSTLALCYACAAAGRGERVGMFIFDETVGTLVARGTALGMNVEPLIDSGQIKVRQVDPAQISPGELTYLIRRSVEDDETRMVVIDSINGYLNAMPDERFLSLQLHELLTFLNQQGVISILVLAQQGLIGALRSVVEITYLADCIVLFRFFETKGEMKQAVSVLKKRSGDHERTIRELKIGANGLQVGTPLRAFHGILTGVPIFEGGDEQTLDDGLGFP